MLTTERPRHGATERVYRGAYAEGEWSVTVRDEPGGRWAPLDRVSPEPAERFAWGYRGHEPAALAYSILADAFDEALAEQHYRSLVQEVVARWPMRGFRITRAELRAWLAQPRATGDTAGRE